MAVRQIPQTIGRAPRRNTSGILKQLDRTHRRDHRKWVAEQCKRIRQAFLTGDSKHHYSGIKRLSRGPARSRKFSPIRVGDLWSSCPSEAAEMHASRLADIFERRHISPDISAIPHTPYDFNPSLHPQENWHHESRLPVLECV